MFKLTFDRDNQLRNNREHLGLTVFKHVEHAFNCQEAIGVLLLANAFHKDRQIVMVIKCLDLNLPVDFIWRSVFNLNG